MLTSTCRSIFIRCNVCSRFWVRKYTESQTWADTLNDAEKVVGYPSSFLSLRYLFSDEVSNLALSMRRLIGTNHPLLSATKDFLYGDQNDLHLRGIIVLLLSKAVSKNHSEVLYAKQRRLAEITEMIHTADILHDGVLDCDEKADMNKDAHFGNKMATLSGDFLLASASTSLAALHETKIVGMMSRAISDTVEGHFLELDLKAALPTYLETVYLRYGSLLAHSCQACVALFGANFDFQVLAKNFGANFIYAYHFSKLPFQKEKSDKNVWSNEDNLKHLSIYYGQIAVYYLDKLVEESDAKLSLVQDTGAVTTLKKLISVISSFDNKL